MKFQPVFDQPYTPNSLLAKFLTSTTPPHSIFDEMRQHNISYVLFRKDLTVSWLQQLSDRDRQRVTPLFNHGNRTVWSGQGHIVLTAEPTF